MSAISDKINHLLRMHSVSQNELAEKIGVSRQVISTLCNGKVKNSKALYPISKFFNVEFNWLSNGIINTQQANTDSQNDILVLDKFHKIPLLTTRLLDKKFLINGKLCLDGISDEYEITNDSAFKSLFTLSTTNNSLKFRFGDKSTLIFHTELEPISGDFIIAYLPEKELFVYRDLEINNGSSTLIPIDPEIYMPISLKKSHVIVAVLYEERIKKRN